MSETLRKAQWPHHSFAVVRATRAEWAKLRATRSTWWGALLIVLVDVGLAALISYVTAHAWGGSRTNQDRLQYDPVRTAQAGVLVAQFVVGVVGSLFVTSEYASGLISTTLLSAHRRRHVLVAKAAVLTFFLLVVGEVAAGLSAFVGRAVLLTHGGRAVASNSVGLQAVSKFVPVLSLGDPSVLRGTLLGGVYLVLLGLCGLALGFLVRSTAGAVSIFVGGLLVLPVVTSLLPSSVTSWLNPYLPTNLGSAMMLVTLHHNAYGGDFLAPWVAFFVLAVYAAVLLSLAGWRLVVRTRG